MTTKVVNFPTKAERSKDELADYLVWFADQIRNSQLEHEPESFAIILTSRDHHEFGIAGRRSWSDLIDSAKSFYQFALAKDVDDNLYRRKTR